MATKRKIEVKFSRSLSVTTLAGLQRHYHRCHKSPCARCGLHGIVMAHGTMKRSIKSAKDAGATPREIATLFAEILLTS